MGGCHTDPWLQTAIPTPATHVMPGQGDCDHRPGESPSLGPGAFRPPGQGCDRGGGSPAATQGLLFCLLPRAEKDGRISSHFRSEGTQSVSESVALSHAYYCRGSSDCGQGRVVYVHRPEGCILSCAYCGGTPSLSPVCLPRSPLAVPSAPVRPLPLPEGFYSVHEGGPVSSAGLRPKDSAVSRRLASLCSLSHMCGPEYGSPPGSCVSVGPQGQLGEELSVPVSDSYLSRSAFGHYHHEGSSVRSQGGRRPRADQSLQAGQAPALHRLPATSRQADLTDPRCALGFALSTPPAEVAQQLSPGRQATPASPTHGFVGLCSCPGSMEGQGLSVQGCSHGAGGVSQGGGHYRCQLHRMGCCVATQGCSRALVSARSFQAHKCSGAARSPFGSQAFFAPPGRQACPHTVGQHLGCVPHQPSGGHQVGTASECVRGSLEMGCSSSGQSAGGVFTRRVQPGRRFSVSPVARPGGVVSPPRRGAQDLGPLWSSGGGSVRLSGVDPLPLVVFSHGGVGRTGPGRVCSSLASCPPVCLPANSSVVAHTTEGFHGGPQAVAGGPILAGTPVVPSATQPVSRGPMAPSGQEGSSVSVGGSDMAPQSSPSPVVGVAPGGPDPQVTGLSDLVRRTVLSARASSTRQQYDNRWRLFSKWCSDRGVDPISCSVPTILEFLQSLLDEGRSPSTLKVYVAAISCNHARVDGCTVGGHTLVSLFLRGARRLRPPLIPRSPVWDLPLVLDALCHPPFEPLARVDLKWLSCKTAFLMAIVSAKRVGELHALSVSPSCLRWSPDGTGVTLWPNTAFVPKVLSRSHCNRPLTLSRFQPSSGEGLSGSEFLCPVRALEAYIAATAGMRRSDQLFLCYGGPKMGCPLSKQRLSHWIVDVICHAYSVSGRSLSDGVRAHSTRSVSTSWAAMRGVPLDAICAAASWASPSTFTRFYNVNVAAPHPLGQALLQGSSGSSL